VGAVIALVGGPFGGLYVKDDPPTPTFRVGEFRYRMQPGGYAVWVGCGHGCAYENADCNGWCGR
jgi:hypothetical protein